MIDFSLPPGLSTLQARVRRFVVEEVVPLETDPRQGPHGPEPALRIELIERARRAELLSPHVAHEYGGLGLSHLERAIVFEEAGASLLAPVAMNVSAPDEGNMHLLEVVATPAQKERWLRPLAEAQIRSCFCMTEPAPGAGSDPGMLATTAESDGEHFLIHGRKWFITGADGASLAIIMATVPGVGATMFLSPMQADAEPVSPGPATAPRLTPGIVLERNMDTLDRGFPGGHGVLRFDGLRVHRDDVLGEIGQGLRNAQVRLSPARLTHCMRWLGAARRAHEVATAYARERWAFGKPIGQHEGIGFMLADNEMDLHVARLATWQAAWVLDQGALGLHESSRAKVIVSEAVWRVADRCVQILGGQGTTSETVVARIFADMRAFRIYDGPSEVHRWSLAKRILKGAAT